MRKAPVEVWRVSQAMDTSRIMVPIKSVASSGATIEEDFDSGSHDVTLEDWDSWMASGSDNWKIKLKIFYNQDSICLKFKGQAQLCYLA